MIPLRELKLSSLPPEPVSTLGRNHRPVSAGIGVQFAPEYALPDETTILKFRRLLERHGLTAQMMNTINAVLGEQGAMLRGGTLVEPRSCTRRLRRRTSRASVIPRCIRPGKGTNGTLE